MSGVKSLVGLAFLGSMSFLLLFLACGLPAYNNWWPFMVVIFYAISPLPTLYYRRFSDNFMMGTSYDPMSRIKDICAFLTTGIVVSAFSLPILLARAPLAAPVIQWGAAGLVITANVVMFLTIIGFFVAFSGDNGYGQEW